MKEGEVLKQFISENNIGVKRFAEKTGIERSSVYQLYDSNRFKKGTIDAITAAYPEYNTFITKLKQRKQSEDNVNVFQMAKQHFEDKGYSPDPPALNDVQRDMLLIDANKTLAMLMELQIEQTGVLTKKTEKQIRKESTETGNKTLKKIFDLLHAANEI